MSERLAAIERELRYEADASRDRRMTVEQAVAALFRAGVVSAAELNEEPRRALRRAIARARETDTSGP